MVQVNQYSHQLGGPRCGQRLTTPASAPARADALFASALQRSDEPSVAQAGQAIAAAVRAFGTRGCAARVAQPTVSTPRPRSRGCAGLARSGGFRKPRTLTSERQGDAEAAQWGVCLGR